MTIHDTSRHRQTWDLIPWLVNDSLDAAQRADIEAHLRECASCREELAFQRHVHAGIQQDQPTADIAASGALSRLFERIDAEDATHPAGQGFDPLEHDFDLPVAACAHGERRPRLSQLLAAAVIVEALGLVGLGTLLAGQRDAAAPYATLSEDVQVATPASIRLVPSPTLSVGQLQSLLDDSGLQIVGSNAGGRILALGFVGSASGDGTRGSRQRVDDVLQGLRANRHVLLAEPILAPGPDPR